MDKLSEHLHIRLTSDERERLELLMQTVGADRSSITRLGDVLTTTDRNGTVQTYGYDALGRQISDSASTKPAPSIIVPTTIWTSWTYTGSAGSTTDPTTESTIGYLESGSSASASMSQTFSSSSGTYAISFDAALRSGDAQGIDVNVDGTDLGTFTIGYNQGSIDYHNVFTDFGTIDMTSFMTGTISLSGGSHTVTLTATATSGDNIAYVNNVVLTAPTESEITATGDPDIEGDAGFGDYGIYLVENFSSGVTYLSMPIHLDAGTYQIGDFTAKEFSDGEHQGGVITLNGTIIGTVQPGNSTPENGSTDTFTVSESGDYTLSFMPLEYGGDSGEGVWLGGSFDLYSPASDFASFTNPASVSGTISLGTIIASQSIKTTYNSQGLVDTVTSYDAAAGSGNIVNQVKNTYNGFGQLTKQYQQHGGAVSTSSTLATTYAYNTSNASENGSRLVSLTYPGGSEIDYNYGGTASLNSAISRLDSMTQGTATLESYQYMGFSTVVEKDHPQDGVNLTYMGTSNGDAGDTVVGLDRFGRVIGQYWVSGTTNASAVLDGYTYTYDQDDNVTSKINLTHSSFSENYTYDGLSRLTAVSRGTDSSYQSFAMNSLGDFDSITTDGSTQTRSTNDQNQIINIGGNSISYDSNGNMTTDDQGNTLIYDAWNRLVAVYNSSGLLLKGYAYDGYGRMTSETNVTTTTDLYYSGTQEIEERTGVTDYTGTSLSSNGTTAVTNVYSPDYINDILLRDSNSTRVYFTNDANFNVTGVVSANGTESAMLQRMVYDAYGTVKFYNGGWTLLSGDTLNLRNLFQGMRFDAAIGWYFTGNSNFGRWYNPRMMVWNRPDAGYIDGMSLYQFVKANPVRFTDPSGLTYCPPPPAQTTVGDYYKPYVVEIPPLNGKRRYVWGIMHQYYQQAPQTRPGQTPAKVIVTQIITAKYVVLGDCGLAPGVRSDAEELMRWAKEEVAAYKDQQALNANVAVIGGAIAALAIVGVGVAAVGAGILVYPTLVEAATALVQAGTATAVAAATLEEEDDGAALQEAEAEFQEIENEIQEALACFRPGTPVLRGNGFTPIETLSLGQRVRTGPNDTIRTAIKQEDYCVLDLAFAKNGQDFRMKFLRPSKLFEGLGIGDFVDLKVLELEVRGKARVLGIGPCPPIEKEVGRVITGAFSSQSIDVRLLRLVGLETPIEVTGNHPVFSEDRKQFVAVSTLARGERLRTFDGVAVVESMNRLDGNWDIYNLEVEGAHQYYISEQRVLAHNANGVTGGEGTPFFESEEQATQMWNMVRQQFQAFKDAGMTDTANQAMSARVEIEQEMENQFPGLLDQLLQQNGM